MPLCAASVPWHTLVPNQTHAGTHRCICGVAPRKFDATRARVLANMGELVVRQLEGSWVQRRVIGGEGLRLQRSLAAYRSPYIFVDTSSRRWMVLHMTPSASAMLGERLAP